MKLKLFLFLFLLITTAVLSQDVKVLLQQGNEAYQNKNFTEAAGKYEQILDSGFEGPSLYYNLGNSYFRVGAIGKAILNYERSLKLEPTDEDARYNLRIAEARAVDNIQEVPRLFFVNWWINILSAFSGSEWAMITLVIYLLFLIAMGFFFLIRNGKIRRLSFYTGLGIFFFMMVSLVFLFARINRDASMDYGVLLKSVESAKISPDEKSGDVFVIHEGMKFEIEDEVNEWTKIKLPDGKVGWLPEGSFETI